MSYRHLVINPIPKLLHTEHKVTKPDQSIKDADHLLRMGNVCLENNHLTRCAVVKLEGLNPKNTIFWYEVIKRHTNTPPTNIIHGWYREALPFTA